MKKKSSRGGRPSRAAAARLRDDILEVATAQFLKLGYGETTIESVARQARVSKRTFYHRFPDKAALFNAVVHRIIDEIRPPDVSDLFVGGTLEAILTRLARAILRAALNPRALELHRIILAEASRFPELATVLAQRSASEEAIERIGALLQREAPAARLDSGRTRFAATQFLQMVVALPQRRALGMGVPMKPSELNRWAVQTTALFLQGWRHWQEDGS